ncbi:LuxR C-terminal-related transcriptional regulator [Streptomyces sp. DH18]|uniref:helix-turn-helix transcriptional regulator n=1 Tax=Streptomyces sp. DH18 TaxID=3040126 RepID=UPI0024435F9E|nr:LuxR family transcriptional regulator [Streptomyces sp. DH18]MDG9687965.1 LuxR C-terminal-related transcriptional regulator [Streptomyces sp. DH18]
MTPSTTVRSPLRLYGRDDELAILESMLARLWSGDGGALVLVAPPGLGRTALLRAAVDAHRDRGPVLYATATPALRAVPYGALHALLGSAPTSGGSSPTAPPPVIAPDALAGRLRELGAGRPLLVCADDAHTWDPASRTALAFAARGLGAGSRIAVLLSATDGTAFAGLPTLHLAPLDEGAASALLDRLTSGTASGADPGTALGATFGAAFGAALGSPPGTALGAAPGGALGAALGVTPSAALGAAPGGALGAALGAEGVDPVVRAELLREAAGNPRLLAGLAGRLTPDQLAGRTPLPFPLPGGEAVLAAHAERLDGLPDRTRALLLLAAAAQEHEPDGAGADALLLLRAGTRGGLPRAFLDRALFGGTVTDGLLQRAGNRVHFAHRLLARAVLHHAPWAQRRAAHELLATLLTDTGDRARAARAAGIPAAAGEAPPDAAPGSAPDAAPGSASPTPPPGSASPTPPPGSASPTPPPGSASPTPPPAPPPVPLAALVQWACAASGPDAVLAARLEAAAGAPFPHAERSAALVRAALLSPEPALRAARFAAAAEQAGLAGDPALARALLARTGPRAPGAAEAAGEVARGLAPYVHGMLALRSGPAADAHEALLAAAALLGPHDPRRALDALLGAAEAAWAAGDALGYLDAMNRLARTPLEAGLEHYRAGMCAVLEGRAAEGHALLRHCLDPAGDRDPCAPAALLRAGVAALVVGDVAAACRAGARALAAVRTGGPDALLPQALEHLAYAELRAGRHAGARAHALEGLHAARRTGQPNSSAHLHAVLALAASVEGPAEACAAHGDAALAGAGPHGLAQAVTLATWARARADLASGRPGEAAARLAPLVGTGPARGHFAARMLAVPCWVEAAVLGGRLPEESRELQAAVDEFASWAARTADPGAPAQLARCRALLAPADEADARYAEALAHHGRAGGDFERARTQLLYGQWLRRRRRTREARGPLRDALVAFQRCSARAWADRAAGELRAAGEPAGVRRDAADGPLAALTPQQLRIARCVAEGATNREVAQRLSLSPRTVDHHLRNVFAALGIRSRTELARLLGP